MCVYVCICMRYDYKVVCRVVLLNIRKIQVFHLTPSLNGDPLGDSVLIAVPRRNSLQTPLLEWPLGPGPFL